MPSAHKRADLALPCLLNAQLLPEDRVVELEQQRRVARAVFNARQRHPRRPALRVHHFPLPQLAGVVGEDQGQPALGLLAGAVQGDAEEALGMLHIGR